MDRVRVLIMMMIWWFSFVRLRAVVIVVLLLWFVGCGGGGGGGYGCYCSLTSFKTHCTPNDPNLFIRLFKSGEWCATHNHSNNSNSNSHHQSAAYLSEEETIFGHHRYSLLNLVGSFLGVFEIFHIYCGAWNGKDVAFHDMWVISWMYGVPLPSVIHTRMPIVDCHWWLPVAYI